MKRDKVDPMPVYFDRYINLIDNIYLNEALENSLNDLENIDFKAMEAIGNKSYASNKWTVKEIFQHIIDVERVLCYRTLLIARSDLSITPSFDPEYISSHSNAVKRNFKKLIDELIMVRKSTIAFFHSFDDEILLKKGLNWQIEMNVLAFGFCIVGHQAWHFEIIRDKYLGL
jgi:hypothetical protein